MINIENLAPIDTVAEIKEYSWSLDKRIRELHQGAAIPRIIGRSVVKWFKRSTPPEHEIISDGVMLRTRPLATRREGSLTVGSVLAVPQQPLKTNGLLYISHVKLGTNDGYFYCGPPDVVDLSSGPDAERLAVAEDEQQVLSLAAILHEAATTLNAI